MDTALQQYQDHQYYLDKLPPGATRVAILVDGRNKKRKWVKIEDLQPTDFLVIDPKDQKPFFMMGTPGRKPSLKPKAVNPLVQAAKNEKERQVLDDPILVAVTEDSNSDDVLSFVMQGLAEEIAGLRFEREQAELSGNRKAAVSISDRRIKALKMMGDAWIKRAEQLQNRQIDLNSTTFRLLFEFIMQTFRESMAASGIKAELIDVVFSNIAKRLDSGWEKEACNVMQKK